MPRLLIDTDTAGDDVTSMLLALRWPGVALEAVTVVSGNVYLEQAVANALYTVEMAGRTDVPVYPGVQRPLIRELVTAHYVHGNDGMGDSNFPAAAVKAQPQHAVKAIIDAAAAHPGELEIIAQGPLTNIALAVRRYPSLPEQVRRLWVMGGCNNSLGNITPASEFNFYVDPEAAHIVLRAGFEVTLVPWDVCLVDGILYRDELRPILEMSSRLSEYYLAVNRRAWEFMNSRRGPGVDGIGHPDSLMMAMAIDHDVAASTGRYFVDVEHRGEMTRGYSLVDLAGVLGEAPNAEVVLRADKRRFHDMLIDVLSG